MYRQVLQISDFPNVDCRDITNILFLGVGGSAISGGLLRDLAISHAHLPVNVCRDYNLPAYVDRRTLCFALSYSGDTQETLSCLQKAAKKKALLIGISSGGELQNLCRRYCIPHIELPRGLVPRVALPYLLGVPLRILEQSELLCTSDDFRDSVEALERLRRIIGPSAPRSKNPAWHLASRLFGSFPMVFSHAALGQVAYRWKTQFNENSKVMSSSAVIPEIGHNEFEAFSFLKKRAHSTSAVILRESEESLDTKVRLNALRAKLEDNSVKVFVVKGKGKSLLERMLYLVYYGDFVSVYLALLSGSDPQTVHEIQWLKNVVRKQTLRKN